MYFTWNFELVTLPATRYDKLGRICTLQGSPFYPTFCRLEVNLVVVHPISKSKNDLYFSRSTLQKKAFSNQNKGHLGFRYIHIWVRVARSWSPPPFEGEKFPVIALDYQHRRSASALFVRHVASAKSWAKRCHGHTFVRFSYTVKWSDKLYK